MSAAGRQLSALAIDWSVVTRGLAWSFSSSYQNERDSPASVAAWLGFSPAASRWCFMSCAVVMVLLYPQKDICAMLGDRLDSPLRFRYSESMDTAIRRKRRIEAGQLIFDETNRACAKYPPFNSLHEGLGVLTEEYYELLMAIHSNNIPNAVHEAMQVGAVALRFVAEFGTAENSHSFREGAPEPHQEARTEPDAVVAPVETVTMRQRVRGAIALLVGLES